MYRGPLDKRVGWTSHKCLPGFCNNILTLPEAQTVCCIHFVRTLSGFSLRSPGYVFTFSSQPSAAFASNASATQDNGSSRAARAAQWGRGRGSCLWPAGAHPPKPPPHKRPGTCGIRFRTCPYQTSARLTARGRGAKFSMKSTGKPLHPAPGEHARQDDPQANPLDFRIKLIIMNCII